VARQVEWHLLFLHYINHLYLKTGQTGMNMDLLITVPKNKFFVYLVRSKLMYQENKVNQCCFSPNLYVFIVSEVIESHLYI
jgi:hypothetical protein